jgi:hypothetical protein
LYDKDLSRWRPAGRDHDRARPFADNKKTMFFNDIFQQSAHVFCVDRSRSNIILYYEIFAERAHVKFHACRLRGRFGFVGRGRRSAVPARKSVSRVASGSAPRGGEARAARCVIVGETPGVAPRCDAYRRERHSRKSDRSSELRLTIQRMQPRCEIA